MKWPAYMHLDVAYEECKAKQASGPRKTMAKFRPSAVNKTILDLSQTSTVPDDMIDDDDDVDRNEKTTLNASKKQATRKSKQNRKSTGTKKASKKNKSTGKQSDPNTLGCGLKKSQFLKLNNTSDSTIKNGINYVTPKRTKQHIFDTALDSSKSMGNDTPLSTNGGKRSSSRHGRRQLGDVTPLPTDSGKNVNSRHGRGHLEDAIPSSPEQTTSPFKRRTPLALSPPHMFGKAFNSLKSMANDTPLSTNGRKRSSSRHGRRHLGDVTPLPTDSGKSVSSRYGRRQLGDVTPLPIHSGKNVNSRHGRGHLEDDILSSPEQTPSPLQRRTPLAPSPPRNRRNDITPRNHQNSCNPNIASRRLRRRRIHEIWTKTYRVNNKDVDVEMLHLGNESLKIFLTDLKKSLLKKDEDLQRVLLDVRSALTQEIGQNVQSIKKGENVSTEDPMMVEEDSDPYETF
uniref:Uncharacterized protein n=1 Tax=Trichogramma kaykai TaxID=54128 RepID=A0ABD2W2A6_9HYME